MSKKTPIREILEIGCIVALGLCLGGGTLFSGWALYATYQRAGRQTAVMQQDRAFRDIAAKASEGTLAVVESKIEECVASGDCLKITGRGAESTTTIDLGLLGEGAVPCLMDTCSFVSKTNTGNLDVEKNGTMIAWSDKSGMREGYKIEPAMKGGKVIWFQSDFDKKAGL